MSKSTARNLARYLALPIVAAGIGAGAVLGTTAVAEAAPTISSNDHGNFHAPSTRATPPVLVHPGGRWHRQHHGFSIDLGD